MTTVKFVGLDVHKDSVMMAVAADDDRPAEVLTKLPYCHERILSQLRKLGPLESLRVCYEAGPTGYGLQRFLARHGVDCRVVAPSLVPQVAGARVKTDRRDARRLAHFLRSGDLQAIWIPDEATEAIRDLVRARDDARLAQRRIRQQLLKFLLRHDRHFTTGKEHWTKTHWNWIRQQRFEQPAQQRVLEDAIRTSDQVTERLRALDEDIAQCVTGWEQAPLVRNLQAFHGIRLLTAVGLVAEIGDFRRFPKASRFMSYTGLVCGEDSTGQSRRLTGITKTGNRHVRRLLVEAAWHYMSGPAHAGPSLAQRREAIPAEMVAIADRAMRRLRKKGHRMLQCRKPPTKIVIALARELAGFIWAIGCATQEQTAGVRP